MWTHFSWLWKYTLFQPTMRSDVPTFTEFLRGHDDGELLRKSSLELEHKLVQSFGALPDGDLLSKISSSCGLTPLLQMELFIVVSILERVVHDRGYSLTPIRRNRYILAFERCLQEIERLKKPMLTSSVAVAAPQKKLTTDSVLANGFYAGFEFCKWQLMVLLSNLLARPPVLQPSVQPLFGRRSEYGVNITIISNRS